MKRVIGLVAFFLLFVGGNNTYAGEKFMHPSTWGTDPADDHYNTFLEDENHVCHKRWYGFEDGCNEPVYNYVDGAYAERSCWYGRHCSSSNKYHAGIDYEVPNHEHDPDDYVNGQRKTIGIKQGRKGEYLGYHGTDDDIVASNCGVVTYAEITPPEKQFGKVVILRHICDPSTSNLQSLCVQEGDDWVIYSQYSHMNRINVSVGDVVHRGQKIGEIGGTGGWIHHLHYEMKTKSVYYSPEPRSNDANRYYYGYTPSNPTNFGYRNPALFINTVKAICPNDNPGNGSNNNPQIFTQGNHTHVIANDYRCSKETNGPILCWEAGGNTNCWDAHKWYQMTCDVEEVPVLRGDSDYTMSLSRDFTCNQVYNSGTNTSTGGDLGGTSYGTGNGTGNGYHNDSGDPWAGYVHHVGLQYLKIGKKSSGHWKGSKVWALSQIPNKRDFRVKLKRKSLTIKFYQS